MFVLAHVTVARDRPLPEINFGLGVPIAGSPILAFVITLLLAPRAVNLGIFLTFARRVPDPPVHPAVIVPQALLAGIFWPVDSLPGILHRLPASCR